ncbi:MAG: polysaccharide deacetylase family protein [Bdellovibrionales bacterium]
MKQFLIFFILFCATFAKADLGSQLSVAVQRTIVAADSATSFDQWLESSGSMEKFFEKIKTLSQEQDFDARLCQALEQLSEKDILLFQAEWDESEVLSQISCKDRLEQRTASFLKKPLRSVLTPHRRGVLKRGEESLGPSLERPVDSSTGPIFFHGDLPEGHFNLTFDDGPHPTLTQKLLDILKAENIQVNFFMTGQRIVKSTPIIQRVVDEKHSVGTHSYSHPDMRTLPFEKAVAEIEDAFKALYAVIGNQMKPFFRFPYGAKTTVLQSYVKTSQRSTYFWNVDTLDWQKRDPAVLLPYALAKTVQYKRGIVLFHDVQPQTIAIMPEYLRALKAKGFKIEVFR